MNELFAKILDLKKELLQAQLKTVIRLQRQQQNTLSSTKRTSNLDIVENILTNVGKSLHISQIITIAKNDYNVVLERDSIVSALIKKIKKGSCFIRVAPNTFALKNERE